MKRTVQFNQLKTWLLNNLTHNEQYKQALISTACLIAISAVIWFGAPYLAWQQQAPLASPEKRLYIIAFLFFAWLLKFLILDWNTFYPWQFPDEETRKKISLMLKRFVGAEKFLQKTLHSKQGKSLQLKQLPWYLLIGPKYAGKTSLLANSQINFILQRQFQQDTTALLPSEHCDWWITHEACIVDVPSNYLFLSASSQPQQKSTLLWHYFLRLLKKRRKENLHGILLALPMPEMMQWQDNKKSQRILSHLLQRVQEAQAGSNHAIPCHLIITKCDMLPGFNEFFNEFGNDEITQAWGINLHDNKQNEKLSDVFSHRFNALIKKLNQQLLWRLHHERNPFTRPYIKDFPLQLERLKLMLTDIIKKFAQPSLQLNLQSIHLTSALQPITETESFIINEGTTERGMQIFKEPTNASRAYFIKQFVQHLTSFTHEPQIIINHHRLQQRVSIGVAAAIFIIIAAVLGRDFNQGLQRTYALQDKLAQFQTNEQQFHNADEQLTSTLALLNSLQPFDIEKKSSFHWASLTSFYSQQSTQKTTQIYYHTLQAVLLPELKNYLQDYLKNPINKNTENIYAGLKSYLMLGDANNLDANFVINTFTTILPKSFDATTLHQLKEHLKIALKSAHHSLPLDDVTILQTQKYLLSTPTTSLSYIILKNVGDNNIEKEINLGTIGENSIFISKQITQIPTMFTASQFAIVYNQQINQAALEALNGNWVLGAINTAAKPFTPANLAEQLRTLYVSNYVDVWESLLANINMVPAKNLDDTNQLLSKLIKSDSPLLLFLQTVHDNTYFDPIISASPKLQALGLLVDKAQQTDHTLYQIFTSLQSLHDYIEAVVGSADEKKAAFEVVEEFMQNRAAPDVLTQLRLVADKSPDPIKNWLFHIADASWHYLAQDAGHYINTAWQENVIKPYESTIANRYPFSNEMRNEVNLQHFTEFFGNPGVVINFYNQYLQRLVDANNFDWRWKSNPQFKLPFSDEALRKFQQAIRIHHNFFPNDDNKLSMQFALQPYQLGKNIKQVKLTLNDKQIVDDKFSNKSPHVVAWPNLHAPKKNYIQLTLSNDNTINHRFSGDWAWFKLINKTFESASSPKQMVLNLSMNEQTAKYLLFTDGRINPLLTLNLNHFHLANELTTDTA